MLRRMSSLVLAGLVAVGTPALALGAGPHGDGHGGGKGGGKGGGHTQGWVAPKDDHWAGHGVDPANLQGCDPLDPAQCMLPYPNDWFTKPDATSATGRRPQWYPQMELREHWYRVAAPEQWVWHRLAR